MAHINIVVYVNESTLEEPCFISILLLNEGKYFGSKFSLTIFEWTTQIKGAFDICDICRRPQKNIDTYKQVRGYTMTSVVCCFKLHELADLGEFRKVV